MFIHLYALELLERGGQQTLVVGAEVI